MNVALDAQLAVGTPTGIGEYVSGLAGALRELRIDVRELREPRLDPWRFDRRVVWDQLLLPLRARRADLLHCASGTMPLVAPAPIVVTVHDVAWLKVQQHARAYARWYFGRFALRRYGAAARIIVDSAFSKRELLGVVSVDATRVDVVHPGVAGDFSTLARTPAAQPFVFVPGTVERRKNVEVLIRALVHLRDVRLISAGPPTPYRDECETLADRLGVRERVTFLGYVPRARLLDLYAACAAVPVPSKYEGFGYAAAQALCAGAPLIVSNCSSLPEVVSGSVPQLEADDAAAWAHALQRIIDDPPRAQQHADALRADAVMRFSWERAARETVRAYERALENR